MVQSEELGRRFESDRDENRIMDRQQLRVFEAAIRLSRTRF